MASDNGTRVPILNSDGSGFNQWKRDIRLWCSVTKVAASKKATVIYLTALKGKARTATQHILEETLQSAQGLNILIETLDKVFLPSKPMRLFNANNKLRNTIRKSDTKIHDYIMEFENSKFLLEQEGLNYDDSLLGLNLLDQCKLSDEKQQLVMSGLSEVTYENMKNKLLAVFYNEFDLSNKRDNADNQIQYPGETEVLYSSGYNNYRGQNASFARGGFRSRGRKWTRASVSGRNYPRSENQHSFRKTNPVDREGRISMCSICESKLHWAKKCPHAYENNRNGDNKNNSSEPHFSFFVTMFTGLAEDDNSGKLKSLREETVDCAIIDSGCASTVCGEKWIEHFKESLSDEEKENIVEEDSKQIFTFGDGSSIKSKKKITFPCWLQGKAGTLTTDVVGCGIPLLLSRQSLKKMNMILDFGNDILSSSTGNTVIKLRNTSSGHYAMPLSR